MKNIKTFEAFAHEDFEPMMVQQFKDEPVSQEKTHGEEPQNYMFFGNLQTIKRCVDQLLEMDPAQVDQILSDGHAWAEDHIATSKDDIEEVFNFLLNDIEPMEKELIQEDPI